MSTLERAIDIATEAHAGQFDKGGEPYILHPLRVMLRVLAALDALGKKPGESRVEAARRAAIHLIALAVKLADNAENSDLSRIPNPTAKDYQRLEEYGQVREILLAADAT